MLHIIPAEDVKREKGVFTRDKLNLYLKNVVELDGMHYRVGLVFLLDCLCSKCGHLVS